MRKIRKEYKIGMVVLDLMGLLFVGMGLHTAILTEKSLIPTEEMATQLFIIGLFLALPLTLWAGLYLLTGEDSPDSDPSKPRDEGS